MVKAPVLAALAPPVPRLWPGATVVCLASGPSLTETDVEACRGRAHVVAVSNTVQVAPFADVLYASDLEWWRFHNGWPTFGGLKYSIEQTRGQGARGFTPWADVQVLKNTGDRGLETARDGLRTGRNSGAAAINLAVHLGAARIVLLGYDCGPDGQKTHFFGQHPPVLRRTSPFAVFQQHFGYLAQSLADVGVAVVNCSRKTRLTCFPRRPWREEVASWV